MVDARSRYSLSLQRGLGRLALFVLGPLSVAMIRVAGYRVRNLPEIREKVRRITSEHKGPWIICANHLTLIDSAIIAYAMAPIHAYWIDYGRFPWNLPEKRNFQRNLLSTIYCYMAKCIPVVRQGDREHIKATLDKCVHLLEGKDCLLVFPEGTRSRTGRVDQEDFSYGVGRFLQYAEDCRVMCVYLRGEGQKTYSDFPRFRERFSMDVAVLKPSTEKKGLRAQRDYAGQIIRKLGEMEEAYFSSCRERCC